LPSSPTCEPSTAAISLRAAGDVRHHGVEDLLAFSSLLKP